MCSVARVTMPFIFLINAITLFIWYRHYLLSAPETSATMRLCACVENQFCDLARRRVTVKMLSNYPSSSGHILISFYI